MLVESGSYWLAGCFSVVVHCWREWLSKGQLNKLRLSQVGFGWLFLFSGGPVWPVAVLVFLSKRILQVGQLYMRLFLGLQCCLKDDLVIESSHPRWTQLLHVEHSRASSFWFTGLTQMLHISGSELHYKQRLHNRENRDMALRSGYLLTGCMSHWLLVGHARGCLPLHVMHMMRSFGAFAMCFVKF